MADKPQPIPKKPREPYKAGMAILTFDDYWMGKTVDFLLNPGKEGAMKLRDFKVMQSIGGYVVLARVQDAEGYKVAFLNVERLADVPGVLREVLEGKVALKPDKYAPGSE